MVLIETQAHDAIYFSCHVKIYPLPVDEGGPLDETTKKKTTTKPEVPYHNKKTIEVSSMGQKCPSLHRQWCRLHIQAKYSQRRLSKNNLADAID